MKLRLLFVSLMSLSMMMACSSTSENTYSKSIAEQQEFIMNRQISWLDALNQQEDNYIIFVYSETCGRCHDMMDEIVDFAKSNILMTYFIDIQKNEVPIDQEIKENIANINELSILGTPTILEVENKVAIKNVPGIDKCLEFLIDKRMI